MAEIRAIPENAAYTQIKTTGGEVRLDYTFPVLLDGYIKVEDIDENLQSYTLIEGTDYDLFGVGDETGGYINLKGDRYPSGAPANHIFNLIQAVPEKRSTDFQQQGDFFARDLNQELDLQIQIDQQLRRDINRAIIIPLGSTLDVNLPEPSPNKSIVWNADGTGLTNSIENIDEVTAKCLEYRNDAEQSATEAAQSAATAVQSAQESATSAGASLNYSETARKWAVGTISEQPNGSAKYWAGQAQISAEGKLTTNVITNCLTEIPQDIKLELTDGTLTLKNGSSWYKGDGTVININSNVSFSSGGANGEKLYFYRTNDNKITGYILGNIYSGDIEPEVGLYQVWFNPTSKKILTDDNKSGDWIDTYGLSLPFAKCTVKNNVITSIDQVFNGFGYVGNIIFALPGIKGKNSNGFNTDGGFNGDNIVTTSVLTVTNPAGSAITKAIGLISSNIAYWSSGFTGVESLPTTDIINFRRYYVKSENKVWVYNGSQWIQEKNIFAGYFTSDETGRITSFNPNTAFHATDYNEFAREVGRCAKVDEENVFTGINTFSNGSGNASFAVLKSTLIDRETNPSQNLYASWIINDKNGNQIANFYVNQQTNGTITANMIATGRDGGDARISTSKDINGTVTTYAPTPPTSDNSTQIATTAWFNNKLDPLDYVVESGGDSDKWYRLYKSGWLVQGGKVGGGSGTVNFAKPYKDTSYNVTLGLQPTDSETTTVGVPCVARTLSTTSIKVAKNIFGENYVGANVYWRTEGQGA